VRSLAVAVFCGFALVALALGYGLRELDDPPDYTGYEDVVQRALRADETLVAPRVTHLRGPFYAVSAGDQCAVLDVSKSSKAASADFF
jgi:hypothetical protein